MEDRFRGVTASLTLVTMAALLVAFGSSSKRHRTETEVLLLEQQVQQLAQVNSRLEEKVRWVEGRYAQSYSLGKRLNQALLREQEKSRMLVLRLGSGQVAQPQTQDNPAAGDQRADARNRP